MSASWGWILVLLLTVFAIAPLTYPGFFQANSGFLPAFNAAHPQMAPGWGRPAAPIQGEGQLPYLLVWPFFLLSGSGSVAVKWGYGLAFFVGALGIYAWSRRWLGLAGAVLAAAVFTYLPWHLGTVYERGAYGEAWLWAFWPWLLWSIDGCDQARRAARLAALAAGLLLLAATLWTQPGLALLSLPWLLAYATIAGPRSRRRAAALIVVIVLALLLLWGLGRMAAEGAVRFRSDYLYPFQLLSARWNLVGAQPQAEAQPSFQLGVAAMGLALVGLALWLAGPQAAIRTGDRLSPASAAPRPLGIFLGYWAVVLAVVLFLTLTWSAPLWQVAGLRSLLVHPWQVLAFAGIPLAFLAGSVPRLDFRLATLPAWAGLLALVILSSYFYLAPDFTQVDPGDEPVALFQPVTASQPEILLLDYNVGASTDLESSVVLTLTWQAVAPLFEDYTVFVHVLRDGDERVAQRDSQPCDGECPTTSWQPGRVIADRHRITLPSGMPAQPLRIALGLYLLDTGERAVLAGGGDTVILDVR